MTATILGQIRAAQHNEYMQGCIPIKVPSRYIPVGSAAQPSLVSRGSGGTSPGTTRTSAAVWSSSGTDAAATHHQAAPAIHIKACVRIPRSFCEEWEKTISLFSTPRPKTPMSLTRERLDPKE